MHMYMYMNDRLELPVAVLSEYKEIDVTIKSISQDYPYQLIGGLLGSFLELLQCGYPLVPVCLTLGADEDVTVHAKAGAGGLRTRDLWQAQGKQIIDNLQSDKSSCTK